MTGSSRRPVLQDTKWRSGGFSGSKRSRKVHHHEAANILLYPGQRHSPYQRLDTQEQDTVTRRSIGYLPENNPLYGDLLVREYLSFVADLQGNVSVRATRQPGPHHRRDRLKEVYYRPINQLSKGYRQRSASPKPSCIDPLFSSWMSRRRAWIQTSA